MVGLLAQAQPSFLYDGRLVYEAEGVPESLPFPELEKIEIHFHLAKPWLAVAFQEKHRTVTYVLDGLSKKQYVLVDAEGEKKAYELPTSDSQWTTWFAANRYGSHGYETTGRTRSLQEKMCREYYQEAGDTWANLWLEPNFTLKGHPYVQQIFEAYVGGVTPLPRGFPFSISSGSLEEESGGLRLDLVEREVGSIPFGLGAYSYQNGEPGEDVPRF